MFPFLQLVRSPPEGGENAVCPVIGGHIKTTKHFRGSDGFRVHPPLLVRDSDVCHGLHEDVDALGLASASGAKNHEAVPHCLSLIQLNQFQSPRRMVDEACVPHLLVDGSF